MCVVLGVLWVGGSAGSAFAAESDASGEGVDRSGERREIAVLSFDEGTEAGALMETVSEELDRAQYDVVAGDALDERLRERQHREVPKEVAADFAGIADEIGDGVKSFFYKGNETAVEELTPIFDLGMGHPEVLVRRPDFAEQIFQAGIVLIRSHRNLNNDGKARAVARQLVRNLPGREPSPSTAPPGTIRFFRTQLEKLNDRGTKLGVEKVGSDKCTAYLNGTQVGTSMYTVAPGEAYYLRLECGTAGAPVWRIQIPEGEHVTAPIAGQSPREFTMTGGDFTSRRRAENYLRLVRFWTEIPQVLGVERKTPADSSEGVLVVRVDAEGEATWSDTQDRGEIRRAISRVMPDYEVGASPAPDPGTGAPARRDSGRWVDWTLVGVGAAGIAGGVIGTILTESRAREIRCSPDTGGTPDDCSGVETVRFDNSDEIDSAEQEVTLARIGYISAYAVGAGLATWGALRLVDRGPERAGAADGVEKRFAVTPRTDGVAAQFQMRW